MNQKAPRSNRSPFGSAGEKVIEACIRLSGWSAIICVTAIFLFMCATAAPIMPDIDWVEFFTSTHWQANPDNGVVRHGALALIVGNFAVALLAMVFAVPLGLGAAVYISEFAGKRTKDWLKIAIEVLAAIPSIVWGFIGITIIGPLLQKYTGAVMGNNLLNGAIVLALMSVPLIVSISEDALRAVPDSFREAALALGANKWETVSRVLFPAAKTGLLAACMLGVGRAVGETMAVLMCTGNTTQIPHSFVDPISTLTARIAQDMGDASDGGPVYRSLFVLGVLLLVITFAINMAADYFIRGNKAKMRP